MNFGNFDTVKHIESHSTICWVNSFHGTTTRWLQNLLLLVFKFLNDMGPVPLANLLVPKYSFDSPWEPPWALEELDIVGFMIASGLKLSHEQHEPDWQNCSLEHFVLISAN